MNLGDDQLHILTQQAVHAARAAGHVINAHRQAKVPVHYKHTGSSMASQVVTEVDRKAQAAILHILQPTCEDYDIALLTEESPDNGQRRNKQAYWCIDPMDGTLAFINNTPGFAVSIALVARDGTPLIGVVYDPVEQVLLQAQRGGGAFKNDQAMQVSEPDPEQPLILQTDFSFQAHPWLEQTRLGLLDIARQLGLNGADIQFRTGAVMNACHILENPNHCYFKYPRSDNSGGSLWDYAATACLYHAAGAVAADILGRPLDLNRSNNTFMNHRGLLYASQRDIADRIIALNQRLQDHL